MVMRWVFCVGFIVLWLSRMNESSLDKQIKVAYLTKGANFKTCLQTDYGSVSPAKKPLDMGGFLYVSQIKNAGQDCDMFHLSMIVDDLLIVIPNRVSSNCFHFTDCRAYVIIKNDNMVVGNTKCYDVLSGHYWHDQQVDTVNDFQIKNMKSRGTVCDYNALDNIIQQKALTGSVSDIFSPVEDIVNNAVAKVEDFGNQFTATINNKLNALQDAVTDQVNTVAVTIQQQTDVVTGAVTTSYNAVAEKIQKIDDVIQKDVNKAEKYFHIFLHILEFIGICVVTRIVYGLYKKANGVYNTVSWIWSRLFPGHHHNAHNIPVNQQNANNHPGQQGNLHPGHQLNAVI